MHLTKRAAIKKKMRKKELPPCIVEGAGELNGEKMNLSQVKNRLMKLEHTNPNMVVILGYEDNMKEEGTVKELLQLIFGSGFQPSKKVTFYQTGVDRK